MLKSSRPWLRSRKTPTAASSTLSSTLGSPPWTGRRTSWPRTSRSTSAAATWLSTPSTTSASRSIHADRDTFVIETPGGLVGVKLDWQDGRVAKVLADMGRAQFDDFDSIVVDGRRLDVTSLSVANPHCVAIVADLAAYDIHELGPRIERHPAFPNRTNVQLAQVHDRQHVEIRIWERGAGYALASGSSGCAVAAACRRQGLIDDRVTILMPGGELEISFDDQDEIRMLGPVEAVFTADLSDDLLCRL